MTNAGRRRQSGWQGTRRISWGNLTILYSYHKLLSPPGGCFGLWSACCFPFVSFPLLFVSLVLCLTLCLHLQVQAMVFFILFYFSSSLFLQCWPPRLRGGDDDGLFLQVFAFILFSFSFSIFIRLLCSCILFWIVSFRFSIS